MLKQHENKAVIIQKWIRGTLTRKKMLATNNKYKQLQRLNIKLLTNTISYLYDFHDISYNYFEKIHSIYPKNNLKKITIKEKNKDIDTLKEINQVPSIIQSFSSFRKPLLELMIIISSDNNKKKSPKQKKIKKKANHKPKKKVFPTAEKILPKRNISPLPVEKNLVKINFISSKLYQIQKKVLCMISIINSSVHDESFSDNTIHNKSCFTITEGEKIKDDSFIKEEIKEEAKGYTDRKKEKTLNRNKGIDEISKMYKSLEKKIKGEHTERKILNDNLNQIRRSNSKSPIPKKKARTERRNVSPYDLRYSQKELMNYYNVDIFAEKNQFFPKVKLIKLRKNKKKGIKKGLKSKDAELM